MKLLADLTEAQERSLYWLTILLVVVVVGGLLIMFLRKLLRDRAKNSMPDAGFSLSDLRAMRDRGEITTEEYEATRVMVLAKSKAALNKPKDGDDASPDADRHPPPAA